MQIVYRANVKDGRMQEFIDWVLENEQAMADTAPEGWTYLGTWVTVHGIGTHDVETRFELDDYAAMSPERSSEENNRLVAEINDFFTEGPGGTAMMKSVGDVFVVA